MLLQPALELQAGQTEVESIQEYAIIKDSLCVLYARAHGRGESERKKFGHGGYSLTAISKGT